MKAHLIIALVAATIALFGCATSHVSSKQEARYRLSEQKRVGLITKEGYEAEMRKVSQLSLPEMPVKPFNVASIQREYGREAKSSWTAPLIRDYNSGAISEAVFKQRREVVVHAMLAANGISSGSTYRPPAGTSGYAQNAYAPGHAGSRYDPNSLSNPYGAGSPYKAGGLMNPYSQYGSRYSNKSWTNPYATNAPKLYDASGNYLGDFSSNKYAPNSTSNPYGKYGSKYSPSSINNPYGAGNPYNPSPVYVVPQR